MTAACPRSSSPATTTINTPSANRRRGHPVVQEDPCHPEAGGKAAEMEGVKSRRSGELAAGVAMPRKFMRKMASRRKREASFSQRPRWNPPPPRAGGFTRKLDQVTDLWNKWSFGRGSGPSIQQLDSAWGAKYSFTAVASQSSRPSSKILREVTARTTGDKLRFYSFPSPLPFFWSFF